eukprot:gnl/TRDRNA2_/TRDRNA2_173405_c0_seq1.p1 gnl/TRDRNA2_/TRDRNA2_173405_c0~~gnl/TRDRNA2_/TRDRNA2_173405_c0_seq1.p1  ORF type:complete len:556 (+),score=136.84 gnl/TRDRNA2_/TRDRNA2_173405_c0_seq1:175-1842(+)
MSKERLEELEDARAAQLAQLEARRNDPVGRAIDDLSKRSKKGDPPDPVQLLNSDHPLRQRLTEFERDKPAPSLEAWFDAGLTSAGDINNIYLVGNRALPPGYVGMDGKGVLLESALCGCVIWPVRTDLVDADADGRKPWTLYHYTHRKNFDRIAEIFRGSDAKEVPKLLFARLMHDQQERVSTPTPYNPKLEPQLSPIEPAKFKEKKQIVVHIYGREPNEQFKAMGGVYLDHAETVEYCVPVRLPASACIPLSHLPLTQASVRLDQEMLQALEVRAAHKAKERKNAEEKRKKRMAKWQRKHKKDHEKKGGCFGCFGRKKDGDTTTPEDTPRETEEENEQSREKREQDMDYRKRMMIENWTMEQMIEIEKKNKRAEKERKEEERLKAMQTLGNAAAKKAEEDRLKAEIDKRLGKTGKAAKILVAGEKEKAMAKVKAKANAEKKAKEQEEEATRKANEVVLNPNDPKLRFQKAGQNDFMAKATGANEAKLTVKAAATALKLRRQSTMAAVKPTGNQRVTGHTGGIEAAKAGKLGHVEEESSSYDEDEESEEEDAEED